MPPSRTPPPGRLPPSYDPTASSGAEAPPDASVAWEPARPSDGGSIPPEHPGRYRAPDAGQALIGQGGIGVVLAVWDEVLGREVACKVLASGASFTPVADRFVREARATARLQHPGIVPVYDLGRRPDGSPFYTMKYVRGRTLASAIAERRTLAERLGLLGAFVDACQAIAYAHSQGVLHRDLKPANVMVGEFGETVVLDWGLARVGEEIPAPASAADDDDRASPDLTAAGAILGTPAYMSPEQAAGAPIDARADTWSLGVILYEILAGTPPFRGATSAEVLRAVRDGEPPPLRAACPDAPPELAAIVRKALARAPSDRYARAADLAADVEAWRSGVRVGAYDYSLLELARRFVGRHQLAFTVGAVAALALAILGATTYVRVLTERNRARAAEAVALRREGEAISNLADALAEKAVSTPEIDPFTAEIYAAGALAMGERPEARGVLARTARRWAPSLDARVAAPGGCRVLAWAGDDILCVVGATLRAFGPDHGPRYEVRLDTTARGEIAVSPDGSRAAIPLEGGTVVVMDARTGAVLRRLDHGARTTVQGVVFSADGTRVFTSGTTDVAGLGIVGWEVATGARIGTLTDPVYSETLARAPDGAIWGTTRGFRDRPRGLLGVDPVTLRDRSYWVSRDSPWGLAWSPDGRWLAAAGGEGTTMVWDARRPEAGPRALGGHGGLGLARWSPDGRILASLKEDGGVTFWEPETWAPMFGTTLPPLSWRALAFSPDGARYAAASEDAISIWRVSPPPAPDGLFTSPSPGVTVACTSDGTSIFSEDPSWFALWRLDGTPIRKIAATEPHTSTSVGPDGALVVADHAGAHILDLPTGKVLGRFESAPTRYAAFTDAGRHVLTLGEDGSLAGWTREGARLWERTDGDGWSQLFGGTEGPALAFGRVEGVDLVDPATGDTRRISDGATLYYGRLSRDGRWATFAWRDGSVSVVDTRVASEVDRFHPYDGANTRVAASDDGRLVAAGGADRVIRIWDRVEGRLVATLRGHERRLQWLDFSPDGHLLVSTGWDGEARGWDLSDLWTPGEELLRRAQARSHLQLDGVRVVPAPAGS